MSIVERLRFDAARCEAVFSKGVASNIEEAAARIEQLEAAVRWALGEAPDTDGKWFGDNPHSKDMPKRFWWRTHLRSLAALAISSIPTPEAK